MQISRISERSGSFQAFPRVAGKILLSGENLMFFLVEIEPSGTVPEHSHHHEQMGMCLSGRAEFHAGSETRIVDSGTVYWFRSNEKHSVRVLGELPAVFLDVFSPPREDYLQRAKKGSDA